jgi:hypothetical protein
MRLLKVANLALAGTLATLSALFLLTSQQEEMYIPTFSSPLNAELPKSPFLEHEDFFQEIGESLFTLKWAPPQMQLPDLRKELIFLGKNGRPDADKGASSYYFSLKGSDDRIRAKEGEKIYLVYQGSLNPGEWVLDPKAGGSPSGPIWGDAHTSLEEIEKNTYIFSPNNLPTPFWFEARNSSEQGIEIRVGMLDEKGSLVTTPADFTPCRCHPSCQAKSQMGRS